MVKIAFTLQDAPDFWQELNVDSLSLNENELCTVEKEKEIAFLVNSRIPKLRECNRRIKNLIITDEKGNVYTTDDFDIPGSLKKEK